MATTGNHFDSAKCLNIKGFKDYMNRLRTIDNTIITNLNAAIQTSTQKEVTYYITNCKSFHEQLMDAYKSRDHVINTCLSEANGKISELKELFDHDDSNTTVQKELNRHKTRYSLIQNELAVEQRAQERSLNALQEKCRRYVDF